MKDDLPVKAKIYLRAAELVEKGHCRRAFAESNFSAWSYPGTNGLTKFCYRGAIKQAAWLAGIENWDAWAEGPKFIDAAEWNNAPETTPAMVAQKLREQAFEE